MRDDQIALVFGCVIGLFVAFFIVGLGLFSASGFSEWTTYGILQTAYAASPGVIGAGICGLLLWRKGYGGK